MQRSMREVMEARCRCFSAGTGVGQVRQESRQVIGAAEEVGCVHGLPALPSAFLSPSCLLSLSPRQAVMKEEVQGSV